MRNNLRVLACLLLCCLIVSGPSPAALAQGSSNSTDAWLERDRINFGEQLTIHWNIVYATEPHDLKLYGEIMDRNDQPVPVSIVLTNLQPKGSYSFTPPAGGVLYLWGGLAGEGPIGLKAYIQGGPQEAPLKLDLLVNNRYPASGDVIQAQMLPSGGSLPYQQMEMSFKVRNSLGQLQTIDQQVGTTASFTVPRGIQGQVEAKVKDAVGRTMTSTQYLAIDGMPGSLFQVDLTLTTSSIRVTEQMAATWQIKGGTAPYKVEHFWWLEAASDGLSMGGDTDSGENWSRFSPSEEGYAGISVTAKDSMGREVTATQDFLVLTSAGQHFQLAPPPVQTPAPYAPPVSPLTPASLNQRMATRSGPGTQYTEELGTLPVETPIRLVHQVTTRGTPWGLVEFDIKGKKHRAYTGMKRIDAYGAVMNGSENYMEATLSEDRPAYYGPGYDYAPRKRGLKAGTPIRVLWQENGFHACDWQEGSSWVRGYLPGL